MDDVKRCKVCDWPLAASAEEGCVEGDCCYRPGDPAEQARIYAADVHEGSGVRHG